MDFLQDNITSCLDSGLGDIDADLKAMLCAELCRRRKLMPDLLPMLTGEGDTSVSGLQCRGLCGEGGLTRRFKGFVPRVGTEGLCLEVGGYFG